VIREVRQRNIQQAGGGGQPGGLGGQLVQREQTGGQHRVVFQDRGALPDPSTQAGPA
jgi:hypothetical protein